MRELCITKSSDCQTVSFLLECRTVFFFFLMISCCCIAVDFVCSCFYNFFLSSQLLSLRYVGSVVLNEINYFNPVFTFRRSTLIVSSF